MTLYVASCEPNYEAVEGATLTANFDGEGTSELFNIYLHPGTHQNGYNWPVILDECKQVCPLEFPRRGEWWWVNPAYGWAAGQFAFTRVPNKRDNLICSVTYSAVPPNQGGGSEPGDNPLGWGAWYDIADWVESEKAIVEAYNLEDIGHNTAKGKRDKFTLGPVENGAREEFEEGIFDVFRDPVLSIHKNVSSLDEVIYYHLNFGHTTNSDNFFTAGPRQARFLDVTSGGLQYSNGYAYYPMVIRILFTDTTDRTMNNVGWNYYYTDDDTHEKILTPFTVKVKDENGVETEELSNEPRFIDVGGQKSNTSEVLHYRYLRERSYAELIL